MTRAGTVLVADGRVALIERSAGDDHWYIFPGSEVGPGESAHDAALREARDELGLSVELERCVAEVSYRETMQYYFLARLNGGNHALAPVDAPAPGHRGLLDAVRETFRPVWLPLSDLIREQVRPRCIVDVTLDSIAVGWPQQPLHIVDRVRWNRR